MPGISRYGTEALLYENAEVIPASSRSFQTGIFRHVFIDSQTINVGIDQTRRNKIIKDSYVSLL